MRYTKIREDARSQVGIGPKGLWTRGTLPGRQNHA
jgi:hypothetical protein